jgi:predicted transcriptional regulator
MAKINPQTEHARMDPNDTATPESDRILALTAEIATAWLSANEVDATTLPGLIQDIRQTLTSLASDDVGEPGPTGSGLPSPAVDPRASVFANRVVCLECGREMSSLRRHLKTAHRLTPEHYRIKWRLPPAYPIVAPDYARRRSEMAKASGLGRR